MTVACALRHLGLALSARWPFLLYHTSPRAAMTKRPQKRRRLSASSSTTSGTDSGPWYAPPLSPPTYDGPGPAEGGPSKAASCISCHRPLSVGTVDGKEGLIVLCPRYDLLSDETAPQNSDGFCEDVMR